MSLFDNLDLAFADDDTRESFAKFRKQYPGATYEDWWDAQAAAISGNDEWHPANDPEFIERQSGGKRGGGGSYDDDYRDGKRQSRRRV